MLARRAYGRVVSVDEAGLGSIESKIVSCGDWAGDLRYRFKVSNQVLAEQDVTFIPGDLVEGQGW
eukprot:2972068-Amphidinium_carterae.1